MTRIEWPTATATFYLPIRRASRQYVCLDQPLAIPSQVAQLTDRGRRHKAAPQQPMLQQLRQPGGIADIGLAARQ
jgi:hypothetical protein